MFLVNELIKGTPAEQFLDFEGSKIEGVYRFYMGFGIRLPFLLHNQTLQTQFFSRENYECTFIGMVSERALTV